jgi:hypothetical protein
MFMLHAMALEVTTRDKNNINIKQYQSINVN